MQSCLKEKRIDKDKLSFLVKKVSVHRLQFCVFVPASCAKVMYNHTIKLYQRKMSSNGFKEKKFPAEYLEDNYKISIEESVKNFAFNHIVLDFLIKNIYKQRISMVNYPRLTQVNILPNKAMEFFFDLSIADAIKLKEWKYLIFRSPKRKLYKDLDKQVGIFLKQEHGAFKKKQINVVENGDWVFFSSTLVGNKVNESLGPFGGSFWIKAGSKHVSLPFQSLLINKKKNDSFVTDFLPIKNDFSCELERSMYPFLVTIKSIVKGQHFALDSFKYHFRLKSKAEVHSKLVEVFSYRNDVSQRKSIVEEVFHLLLSKHRFEVPKHFVVRRQEDILSSFKKHPDYQVYKLQKDFYEQVEALAEKLLKEEILIDQIAYNENISVDKRDFQSYLYLFNNNRLKEFVYFKPTLFNIEEYDVPLQDGLLELPVLREKTLNFVIHELTK